MGSIDTAKPTQQNIQGCKQKMKGTEKQRSREREKQNQRRTIEKVKERKREKLK